MDVSRHAHLCILDEGHVALIHVQYDAHSVIGPEEGTIGPLTTTLVG